MPYAGFFSETAERDCYIKKRNIKNNIEDFESICSSNGSSLLNVNKEQIFVFEGSQLVCRKKDETEKMDSSTIGVVANLDANEVDEKLKSVVIDYFNGSDFKDNLLVDLRPTTDNFESGNIGFRIDFSSKNYSVFNCNSLVESIEDEAASNGLRYLQIKVRRNELLDVVTNGKPWEDLSIGFQCRIYRVPNIYNSEFWFYFTNVYIGNKVISSTPITIYE